MSAGNREESVRLVEIAARVGGEVIRGDGNMRISGCAALDRAGPGDLSFLTNPRYRSRLADTRAGAVLMGEPVDEPYPFAVLVVKNPYLAFARILDYFHPVRLPAPGIHPSAEIGEGFRSGKGIAIGAHAVIGRDVGIGDGTAIFPGVAIGDHVTIGENSIIYPNATIYYGSVIGSRVIVHAGAVIGSDGFGFARDGAAYHKVPQIGHVVVEDDVEIGANTTIDRGSMGVTRIGRGVKLDNLIHVAHNVTIGEDTAIAAQTGISGSTRIGNRVIMGGQVGITGHIDVGDDSILTAKSGITKSVPPKTMLSGYPSAPHKRWLRNQAVLTRGIEWKERVKALELQIESLKSIVESLKKEKEN